MPASKERYQVLKGTGRAFVTQRLVRQAGRPVRQCFFAFVCRALTWALKLDRESKSTLGHSGSISPQQRQNFKKQKVSLSQGS